jgi:integrase
MRVPSLPVLCERYLRSRVVSPHYAYNVRHTCGQCRTLSVDSINRYLQKRLTEVASITVSTERAILVGIWRWAYDTGVVDTLPRGLVKIKVARRPTRAWTLEQCCTAVKGTFLLAEPIRKRGVTLGLFLRAWMLLGYEVGARQGDLWKLRAEDFDGDVVRWSQHKTGEPHLKTLSPACLDAVNAMLAKSPDGRVLGWVMTRNSGRRRMRAYLKSIKFTGSSKWLRRSGATHVEMENPGKGKLHLGHKTPGLAERCYIDWSQVRRDIPRVPQLIEQ